MNRFSDDERDTTFGLTMCTLRAALGLTQAQLAKVLGVSKRTVGDWEAGNRYPRTEHLKDLIELGMERKAFTVGREGEAIRALWQAAHQKEPLDEQWLVTLLGRQPFAVEAPWLQIIKKSLPCSPSQIPVASAQVDWGGALSVPNFYGRKLEQTILTQWVLGEHCRLVSVVGIGGIGKSALAIRLMQQMAEHFEVVIFRSLRDAPLRRELLDDCLQVLSPQVLAALPADLGRRINLLLEQMRTRRVLLVLDNLEAILQEGDAKGCLRSGCQEYEHLLRRIAEAEHQSCLLLTSREKLAVLGPLEGSRSPVRLLRLSGLEIPACQQLLAEKQVVGTQEEQAALAEVYGGNPLALQIVGETIGDLFGGEIGPFLSEGIVVFGSITDLLDEQFVRLSELEQMVLRWLAIVREPMTVDELLALLVISPPCAQVLEALNSLWRRCLVERGQRQSSFTLQAVVLEYVTTLLVEEAISEIGQCQLNQLLQHGLEQAHAKAYVRQTQERLLINPILVGLRSGLGGQAAVEKCLRQLLNHLRTLPDSAQGYGPANLVALLQVLQGHLRGVDLSHLSLRGVCLQGIEMRDASLVGSILRDTIFTEPLDAIWSVAVSCTGHYWAVGSQRGEVRVWSESGQRLYLVWQAHTDNIFTLTFSPDERTLATGSWDSTIKLWDVQSGSLLWKDWQGDLVFGLAFAPDGCMLACGGNKPFVRLLDIPSGTFVQELESYGSAVISVVWSPDGQWIAAGCYDGSIVLWQLQEGKSTTKVRTLVGHTNWVHSLTFSPDGMQLVSGSWDTTVKLWDVTSGRLLQTLTGHTQRVYSVAWSPDGRTVASASFDKTVCVWDVAENRYRTVLAGHTAVVYNIAFNPDSSHLLSGSEDGTLRVWDVMTGRCIRTIEGYSLSCYDLAWSPAGRWLASVGSSQLVTIWDTTEEMQPRDLHGHRWTVYRVAWSPDGQLLASAGWDNIRVWESATGSCLHVLRDPDYEDAPFWGLAWSPDGRWLVSGTSKQGLQMWEMRTFTCCWVGRQITSRIPSLAWSPDGTRLACCGDDCFTVWEVLGDRLLKRLHWPRGMLCVAWSPDGKWLACGGNSGGVGEVEVWGVTCDDREKPILSLSGLASAVYAVAWSPSGNVLISGDSGGYLRWWDVETGVCLRKREGHRGAVQALKVSPDGRVLASSGHDSAIRLWDLESGQLLRTLRRDRPYERLDITGIRGLTEAQKLTLKALGAIEL